MSLIMKQTLNHPMKNQTGMNEITINGIFCYFCYLFIPLYHLRSGQFLPHQPSTVGHNRIYTEGNPHGSLQPESIPCEEQNEFIAARLQHLDI